MNVWEVAKTIGKGILGSSPAGAAVMGVINAVTGEETLDKDSTGEDAQKVIDALPAEQKAQVLEAKIQAAVEHDAQWTERFKAMNTSSMAWVRPLVVLMMAAIVAYTIVEFLSIIRTAVEGADSTDIPNIIRELGAAWPAVAAILAIPSFVIRAWFAHREQAKQRAAELATGQAITPIQGLIQTLVGKYRS